MLYVIKFYIVIKIFRADFQKSVKSMAKSEFAETLMKKLKKVKHTDLLATHKIKLLQLRICEMDVKAR